MPTSNLLFPIVWLATEDLTNAELVALNEIAQMGHDPHSIGSYPQVSDLFTEDNGSRMHRETRRALAAVTLARLMPS
jgi:hypothetical protein